MLSVETSDTWGFTVDVDVGGAETYTNADSDAISSMYSFWLWLNAPARGWFGVASFSWSWARDATTGGAILTLTSTAPFGFDMTNGAHARLGLPADTGATAIVGDQPATGTWAPDSGISFKRYARILDRGDASGDGSTRPGVPGLAPYRPTCEAIGTAIDTARLAAVLATATNPRRALVWQVHSATWIEVAIGRPNRQAVDTTHYRVTLETAGVSL